MDSLPKPAIYGIWGGLTFGGGYVVAKEVMAHSWSSDLDLLIVVVGAFAFCVGNAAFVLAVWRGSSTGSGTGPISNYDTGKVLGQGAFGLVVEATVKVVRDKDEDESHSQMRIKAAKAKKGQIVHHHDPQQFAIKYLTIDNVATATEGIMEATKLVRCQHPNIVNLREQFFRNRYADLGLWERLTQSPFQLCLVMERCDGDLMQLIRSWAPGSEQPQTWGGEPPFAEKLRILVQIVAAVAHIHETKPSALIHRDLKPENVFIAHIGEPSVPAFPAHAPQFVSRAWPTAILSTIRTPGDQEYPSPCENWRHGPGNARFGGRKRIRRDGRLHCARAIQVVGRHRRRL